MSLPLTLTQLPPGQVSGPTTGFLVGIETVWGQQSAGNQPLLPLWLVLRTEATFGEVLSSQLWTPLASAAAVFLDSAKQFPGWSFPWETQTWLLLWVASTLTGYRGCDLV